MLQSTRRNAATECASGHMTARRTGRLACFHLAQRRGKNHRSAIERAGTTARWLVHQVAPPDRAGAYSADAAAARGRHMSEVVAIRASCRIARGAGERRRPADMHSVRVDSNGFYKINNGIRDFPRVRLKREVPGVEKTYSCVRQVTLVGLCAWREEERIVLAPDGH